MAVGRVATCTGPLEAWMVSGELVSDEDDEAAVEDDPHPRARTSGITARVPSSVRCDCFDIDHPPSVRGGRSAPAATPGGGIERTALPPRTGCVDARPGARARSPSGEHYRCGTAPESHRTSLNVHHFGTNRSTRTLARRPDECTGPQGSPMVPVQATSSATGEC